MGKLTRQERVIVATGGPGDTDGFYGHTGMTQLDDGTILLPYIAAIGSGHQQVVVRKSADQGHSWSEPVGVLSNADAAEWAVPISYGKIREFQDGSVILPLLGRKQGERYGHCGYLRSTDGGETWPEYITAAHERHAGDENDLIQLPFLKAIGYDGYIATYLPQISQEILQSAPGGPTYATTSKSATAAARSDLEVVLEQLLTFLKSVERALDTSRDFYEIEGFRGD